MNTENNLSSLDEMKQQLQILQKRLDSQIEINDKQLRRAIHSGMSSMLRREFLGLIMCLILTPLLPLYIHEIGQPLWTVIVSLVFMLLCDLLQIVKYSYMYRTSSMMSHSLVETQQRLLKYKRLEIFYLTYIAPVMVIGFMDTFFYSIYTNGLFGETMTSFIPIIIGGVVGGIIGGTIGIMAFVRPQFRKIDEVTQSIANLENNA